MGGTGLLVEIAPAKARLLNGRDMGMAQFLLLFQEYLSGGLKGVGTEQVLEIQRTAIGIAIYCQKDEWVDHMFYLVFVDNSVTNEYVERASYVPNVLESRASRKCALSQAIRHPSPFEVRLYLHALMILKVCMQEKLVCALHH